MRISDSDMNRLAAITALYECLDGYIGRVHFSNYEGGDDSPNETAATYLRMVGEVSAMLSSEFKDATRGKVMWGLVGMMSFTMQDTGRWDEAELLDIADNDMFRLSRLCDEWLRTGKAKVARRFETAV